MKTRTADLTTESSRRLSLEIKLPDHSSGPRPTSKFIHADSHRTDTLLANFRQKLLLRGVRDIISIARYFKIIDDDNSGAIDIDEFTKAVSELRLDVSIDDIRLLFSAFDKDKSGEISYDEFLRVIKGEVSAQRLELIERAFKSLDRDGSGIVDYKDI